MGLGNDSSGRDLHQAALCISKVTQAFQVRPPIDLADVASVEKLVSYIARERGLSHDATVTISPEPPSEEVEQEAFRRLQSGLRAIGGTAPESIGSRKSPDKLVPIHNRHAKWSRLAEELQCDLPEFDNPKRAMWLSMFITSPFVCVFMVLLLTPIFLVFGIAEEAPWFVKIILGPMIYVGTVFLGAVAACEAESFLFRHPLRIRFDSIREFNSHIAENARGIKDALRKNVATTIDRYVREVVADEFGLTPVQTGEDYQLIPESNLINPSEPTWNFDAQDDEDEAAY